MSKIQTESRVSFVLIAVRQGLKKLNGKKTFLKLRTKHHENTVDGLIKEADGKIGRKLRNLIEQLAEAEQKGWKMRDALEELSRLGNGNYPGNSDGNRIAQQALK